MNKGYLRSGGDRYLERFPKFQRWINVCGTCGRKGYKPEMPDHIGKHRHNVGAGTIRQFFEPLELDADGLCDQCCSTKELRKPSHDT